MKNKWVKIMAFLALFWIIVSVIWTWLLVVFSWDSNQEVKLTQKQIEQIQNMINSWSLTTWSWDLSWSGEIIEIK